MEVKQGFWDGSLRASTRCAMKSWHVLSTKIIQKSDELPMENATRQEDQSRPDYTPHWAKEPPRRVKSPGRRTVTADHQDLRRAYEKIDLLCKDRINIRPPSFNPAHLGLAAGLMLDAAVAWSAGVILGDATEAEHADVGEAVALGDVEIGGGVVRGGELGGSEFVVGGDETDGDIRAKADAFLVRLSGEVGDDALGEFRSEFGDGGGGLSAAQFGPDQLLLRLLFSGRRHG